MYKIVYYDSKLLSHAIEQVEKSVNTLKNEGWIEQGSVSVSSMGIDGFYIVAQAMIKNEKI